MSERDARHSATLATAAHSYKDVVLLNVDQLHHYAVCRHGGVDFVFQNCFDLVANYLGRRQRLARLVADGRFSGLNVFPDHGPDLPARIFLDEKIRVCGLLGKLKAKAALGALKTAARSKEPELAAAAQRAIEAIGS